LSLFEEPGLDEQFNLIGIRKEKLHAALRTMGTRFLQTKEMKAQWSTERPTKNYCYTVSELVYWYVAPKGTTVYVTEVPGSLPGVKHWFLRLPDGTVIDLTSDQFDTEVDYTKGKKSMFLQTGCKGPSKRARHLAILMGFKDGNDAD